MAGSLNTCRLAVMLQCGTRSPKAIIRLFAD
jgi:hypothetical protein